MGSNPWPQRVHQSKGLLRDLCSSFLQEAMEDYHLHPRNHWLTIVFWKTPRCNLKSLDSIKIGCALRLLDLQLRNFSSGQRCKTSTHFQIPESFSKLSRASLVSVQSGFTQLLNSYSKSPSVFVSLLTEKTFAAAVLQPLAALPSP